MARTPTRLMEVKQPSELPMVGAKKNKLLQSPLQSPLQTAGDKRHMLPVQLPLPTVGALPPHPSLRLLLLFLLSLLRLPMVGALPLDPSPNVLLLLTRLPLLFNRLQLRLGVALPLLPLFRLRRALRRRLGGRLPPWPLGKGTLPD